MVRLEFHYVPDLAHLDPQLFPSKDFHNFQKHASDNFKNPDEFRPSGNQTLREFWTSFERQISLAWGATVNTHIIFDFDGRCPPHTDDNMNLTLREMSAATIPGSPVDQGRELCVTCSFRENDGHEEGDELAVYVSLAVIFESASAQIEDRPRTFNQQKYFPLLVQLLEAPSSAPRHRQTQRDSSKSATVSYAALSLEAPSDTQSVKKAETWLRVSGKFLEESAEISKVAASLYWGTLPADPESIEAEALSLFMKFRDGSSNPTSQIYTESGRLSGSHGLIAAERVENPRLETSTSRTVQVSALDNGFRYDYVSESDLRVFILSSLQAAVDRRLGESGSASRSAADRRASTVTKDGVSGHSREE